MLLHSLCVTAVSVLVILSTIMSVASASDEDMLTFVDGQTRALDTKLKLFENKLKYFLKYNISENTTEKFKKYVSMTIDTMQKDLSNIKIYTHLSLHHNNTKNTLNFPIWNMSGHHVDGSKILFRACEHIIEMNYCKRREQTKKHINTLIQLTDKLLNIKSRFLMYKTIYTYMTEEKYDNLYNLNSFLRKLENHFMKSSFVPNDVISEARYIMENIRSTYKRNAVEEIREEIMNECSSAEVVDSFWELSATLNELDELDNVLDDILSDCDSSCIKELLNKGELSSATYVNCQIAKRVYDRQNMQGKWYDTALHFKVAKLVRVALSRRNSLRDVAPCLDIRDALDTSVRSIVVWGGYSCIENQLYKTFLSRIPGQNFDKENGMIFLTSDSGNRNNAKWSLDADGSNLYWIKHKESKKYLYASRIPFNVGDMDGNAVHVFTSENAERKTGWYFNLVPDGGGITIQTEGMQYLFATNETTKGGAGRYIAVWQGQGVPPGAVWRVGHC